MQERDECTNAEGRRRLQDLQGIARKLTTPELQSHSLWVQRYLKARLDLEALEAPSAWADEAPQTATTSTSLASAGSTGSDQNRNGAHCLASKDRPATAAVIHIDLSDEPAAPPCEAMPGNEPAREAANAAAQVQEDKEERQDKDSVQEKFAANEQNLASAQELSDAATPSSSSKESYLKKAAETNVRALLATRKRALDEGADARVTSGEGNSNSNSPKVLRSRSPSRKETKETPSVAMHVDSKETGAKAATPSTPLADTSTGAVHTLHLCIREEDMKASTAAAAEAIARKFRLQMMAEENLQEAAKRAEELQAEEQRAWADNAMADQKAQACIAAKAKQLLEEDRRGLEQSLHDALMLAQSLLSHKIEEAKALNFQKEGNKVLLQRAMEMNEHAAVWNQELTDARLHAASVNNVWSEPSARATAQRRVQDAEQKLRAAAETHQSWKRNVDWIACKEKTLAELSLQIPLRLRDLQDVAVAVTAFKKEYATEFPNEVMARMEYLCNEAAKFAPSEVESRIGLMTEKPPMPALPAQATASTFGGVSTRREFCEAGPAERLLQQTMASQSDLAGANDVAFRQGHVHQGGQTYNNSWCQ
eukprot:TRINITY_DN36894_c0_g1_i1.p1 TRINITY_DN36894_c0_g1~~TRINITY_DN36894_c0_g1_i1.p1  ORF type:complete len:595 (+),score=138.33 TRINITY_DN36894_c0_g1_i1:117-1901(+)